MLLPAALCDTLAAASSANGSKLSSSMAADDEEVKAPQLLEAVVAREVILGAAGREDGDGAGAGLGEGCWTARGRWGGGGCFSLPSTESSRLPPVV